MLLGLALEAHFSVYALYMPGLYAIEIRTDKGTKTHRFVSGLVWNITLAFPGSRSD